MKEDFDKIPKMDPKDFDAGIKSEMDNSVIRMSEYRMKAEILQDEIQEQLKEKQEALDKAQQELQLEQERSIILK